MERFKLALIQMRVRGGQPELNLARAKRALEDAAGAGAQVALLPEAMTLGWTHPSARSAAETIPGGPACGQLQEASAKLGLYIAAGIVERSGDQVCNSAVLFDPAGRLLAHHRKLYELEIAHDLYALGDRLSVARTPLAAFGLMICADAFAPGQAITRTLGFMGAEVILSPCAWAVPADHDNRREPYGKLWVDNYGPVARDFRLWIAGASNIGSIDAGPWQGRKCIGCSLVVGPDGCPVTRGPYAAEAILYADITPVPRPAQGTGWDRLWSSETGP